MVAYINVHGKNKVDIMHFLVGSTPCKMLPDVGICCNTLGCMIHAQLMFHCVTSLSCSYTFCAIPTSFTKFYKYKIFIVLLVSVLFMEHKLIYNLGLTSMHTL